MESKLENPPIEVPYKYIEKIDKSVANQAKKLIAKPDYIEGVYFIWIFRSRRPLADFLAAGQKETVRVQSE